MDNRHIISINGKNVIILIDSNDIRLTSIAQMAKIGGATLPSGFKVPEGDWTIIGKCLVQDYTNENYELYLSLDTAVPE